MGHVFAEIELSNPRQPDFVPIVVNALVDTDALMLCIPEHIANQLDLTTESMREVSVADGRSSNVPYVGPIKLTFGKRFCYVGALVLGDEVLLGTVPMEDMDLVVNPSRREVTVDPASPNIPHARVKSLTSRSSGRATARRRSRRRASRGTGTEHRSRTDGVPYPGSNSNCKEKLVMRIDSCLPPTLVGGFGISRLAPLSFPHRPCGAMGEREG